MLEIPNYIGCLRQPHPTEQTLIYEEVIQTCLGCNYFDQYQVLFEINKAIKYDDGHGFLCLKNIP